MYRGKERWTAYYDEVVVEEMPDQGGAHTEPVYEAKSLWPWGSIYRSHSGTEAVIRQLDTYFTDKHLSDGRYWIGLLSACVAMSGWALWTNRPPRAGWQIYASVCSLWLGYETYYYALYRTRARNLHPSGADRRPLEGPGGPAAL